jgi:hypothetical protein
MDAALAALFWASKRLADAARKIAAQATIEILRIGTSMSCLDSAYAIMEVRAPGG